MCACVCLVGELLPFILYAVVASIAESIIVDNVETAERRAHSRESEVEMTKVARVIENDIGTAGIMAPSAFTFNRHGRFIYVGLVRDFMRRGADIKPVACELHRRIGKKRRKMRE